MTEAIYDAGFNSGGRFYETSDQILGMTPSDYRAGGADTEIRFAVGECSLGSVLVAQSAKGVCAILLGDDPGALVRELQDRFPRATLVGRRCRVRADGRQGDRLRRSSPRWGSTCRSTCAAPHFNSACGRRFAPFRSGSTATYTAVAARIGAPQSARAVAQACGANRVGRGDPLSPRREN